MEGERRRVRNGGSVGGARRQDDALGRQWETVPSLGLLFCLALGSNDGEERLHGFKPGCHIGQAARETHVVLWGRLGWYGGVGVCPTMEPDA